MRGFILIGFALLIDFIQGMFMLAFAVMQFITPVGGGFTGALAAGWYCWKTSTGIIAGISSAASCFAAGGVVGAGVSAFAIPLGMGIDVVISITLGGALILALGWMGMFYPGPIISAFIGESLPLIDIIPGWTLLVWRCLSNKKAEEKAAKVQQQQNQTPTVVINTARAFDGIRAANDNQSSYAQAA